MNDGWAAGSSQIDRRGSGQIGNRTDNPVELLELYFVMLKMRPS